MASNETSFKLLKSITAEVVDTYVNLNIYIYIYITVANFRRNLPIHPVVLPQYVPPIILLKRCQYIASRIYSNR